MRCVVNSLDRCKECNLTKYSKHELLKEYDREVQGDGEDIAIRIIGPLRIADKSVRFIVVIIALFNGSVNLYPLKEISMRSLICLMTTKHFPYVQIPKRIMANELVFYDQEWRNFLRDYSCEEVRMPFSGVWSRIRRKVKEIDRIIEVYKNTKPINVIIRHLERILNYTRQKETGYAAIELLSDGNGHLPLHPKLMPYRRLPENWFTRIANAKTNIEK